MRDNKILRKAGLLAASGMMALALAAIPAAPGLDAGFLGLKSAQAKGNGNNGGNGGDRGNSGNAGNHGNSGNGNGFGSTMTTAGGQGITSTTVGHLKGNLNAYHASVMAFKNAADESMVGQLRSAITDPDIDPLLSREENQRNALEALSNQPVDEDVLEEVRSIVSDKVDAAAEVTVESEETEETDDLEEI